MYHSVRPGKAKPAWPWALSAQRFDSHLRLLRQHGYLTPTFAERVAAEPGHWHNKRVAAMTFDDGYCDKLAAAPALACGGMRASFFVVAGSVGKKPAWAAKGGPADRLLDAAELRALLAMGMEVGPHGVHHVRFTSLTTARSTMSWAIPAPASKTSPASPSPALPTPTATGTNGSRVADRQPARARRASNRSRGAMGEFALLRIYSTVRSRCFRTPANRSTFRSTKPCARGVPTCVRPALCSMHRVARNGVSATRQPSRASCR